MKIKFIEGGNPFRNSHDSMKYCVLNKKAIDDLHIDPPYINKHVYPTMVNPKSFSFIIKGVIENTNDKSLTQRSDPQIYMLPRWQSENGIILIKISSDHARAIAAIRSYWQKEFPSRPFEYTFLDDTYNMLYKSEINTRKIIAVFTIIAIILTSLGLLAMAFYTTEKRTKEIGIRKVNGASVLEIIRMLNKDFLKWVVVAIIIAVPLAWYAMVKWLENFAYKTVINWWIFAFAGILALAIAVITVSFHSWKSARKNPVEVLRYE